MPRSHDARSLVGANTLSVGYEDNGQLPNITSSGWGIVGYAVTSNGALQFTAGQGKQTTSNGNVWAYYTHSFDASRCSNIYDSNATAVLPRRLQVLHCIKYI